MIVADADWKRRKLEILNKIEQFQKIGWKSTGFVAYNNADELRKRLYFDNQKYSALFTQNSHNPRKDILTSSRMTPQVNKTTVLPPISSAVEPEKQASQPNKLMVRGSESRTFTVSPINFMDVVRDSATKIEYIRKYLNNEGEVVVKNQKIYKKAKIGSLENVEHNPPPSQVKIHNKPLPSLKVKSKIGSLDNISHQPRGGKRKIYSQRAYVKSQSPVYLSFPGVFKLSWNSKSKVGSLDNMGHQPSGGHSLIFRQRLQWEASPKVGSLDNIGHVPSRSFPTLQNYTSPIRRKLLEEGEKVIWTEGCEQHVIQNPKLLDSVPRYKILKPQAKLLNNEQG